MLEWDERKGILYAYKHSLARPDLFPENNTTVYNSFNEYINGIVQKDVQNEFIPAIEKIMLHNGGISVCPEDIRVIEPELKGYFPDKSRLVQVKFLVPKTTSEPEWITIMRIPDVGEDNVLQINGKKYAFINMLEQEPSISFKIDKGEMRLKLINGLQSLSIVSTKSGVKVEFSKMKSLSGAVKKYDILQIIFALAKYEGFDPRAVFDEYSSYAVTQQADIDDGINLEQRMANIIGTASIKASEYENELVPMLKLFAIDFMNRNVEAYSNVSIRNRINKLLSMDMALDRVLAKDVYSTLDEGKLVAKAGQVVTNVMLNDFDVEGVYKIDVTIEPQIEGNYLAEDVYIFDLHKGIKVCDIIREAIPSEANNMYLSENYNYKEFANGFPILLQSKTEITKDIINILLNYGVTQVLISDKPTGGSKHVYRFYEEIMSNRQFKRQFGGTLQWCYLDAENNFVPNDGSYTTYDFAALLSYCIKLFSDRYTDRVVDVDKGFRKRLVPLSEQYHKAFVWACYKAFDQMKDSLRNTYKGDMTTFMHADMIENKFYPFTKNFLAYLRDEVRCLEELTTDNIHNPVAYISACTKANVFVKSKHAVSDQQRDIAVGSYGKIDPYEVPQSGKLGVASHLCCDTRISEADEVLEDGTIICKGSMQTAYYGLVHKGTITKIDLDNKVWLTAEQEEQYVIADICSIDFDENNCCADNTKLVQCRVPNSKFNEKSTFAYKHISEVEYVNCSAQQSLGWASATIPFIASNDAARAIFAVAQMKQGKGLINPEEPDVLTSAWEQIPVINNKFCFIAKKPGEVYSCVYDRTRSKYSLQLLYMDGTSEQLEYPVFLNSGISVTKFNILVDEGDTFDKGDVLVSSNFISKNGIMTLGINALVGYICDGWNYEDGAHISETLSSKLASYRINSEVIEGKPEVDYEFRIGSQINTSYSRPGACSVDVSFKTKVGTTVATHTHVRTIKKAYGFYEYQENVHGQKPTNKNRVTGVKLNFVSVDKFGVGDKISNRHGNKGVISVVSPTADMPRLKNGMPLELCLNPLGVGSRMNIGQIKELHSGLVTHICGFKLSADAYNSISDQELAELLSLVYDLANSTDDGNAAFSKHNELFAFMKNGYEFQEFLRSRLDYIRLYAGCFEEDGTAYVELPTNDGKLAKVRIPVGYLYIYKLTQEVEEKFHVRGGQNNNSKYTKIAKAPTEGAHNGGGQRLGTMEMDALCAYGVSSYIHELVNERADNAIARSNFIADTFLPKNRASEFKRPNGRPQRRAVTQFLYSMLSLGIMMEPTEKESIFSQEFVPLSKQNSEQCVAISSKALNRVGTKAEGSIRFRDQDISMPTHYARDLMIQDMEEGDEDAIEAATEEDLHIEHPGQNAGDITNGPMSLFEAASKTDTSKNLKSVLLKKKE